MNTITYKTRTERFFDDFDRELHKTGLREAIAELTRRLDALESPQPEISQNLGPIGPIVTSESVVTKKRRPGRPKGRGMPKAHIKIMVRAIQREKCAAFQESRALQENN